MKRFFLFVLLSVLLLSFSMTSCVAVRVKSKPHKVKSIPPGHAKKVVKGKSAKPFAPGQNK